MKFFIISFFLIFSSLRAEFRTLGAHLVEFEDHKQAIYNIYNVNSKIYAVEYFAIIKGHPSFKFAVYRDKKTKKIIKINFADRDIFPSQKNEFKSVLEKAVLKVSGKNKKFKEIAYYPDLETAFKGVKEDLQLGDSWVVKTQYYDIKLAVPTDKLKPYKVRYYLFSVAKERNKLFLHCYGKDKEALKRIFKVAYTGKLSLNNSIKKVHYNPKAKYIISELPVSVSYWQDISRYRNMVSKVVFRGNSNDAIDYIKKEKEDIDLGLSYFQMKSDNGVRRVKFDSEKFSSKEAILKRQRKLLEGGK